MKFLHIADLHIGKKLKDFSLEIDQRIILHQIASIAEKEHVGGLLIAGDVYDSTSPSGESSLLLDEFITKILNLGIKVFMISGNHDSGEKLSFGHSIFEKEGLHICGLFDGKLQKITIDDSGRTIGLFMLPFIRPIDVSRRYKEEKISSYADAVSTVIRHSDLSGCDKKILMTHQFISGSTAPELSESETAYVGTAEMIPHTIFDDFDYVALGHLHIPQSVGRETIRYSGSPLKYSKSEALKEKSVTIIDIDEDISIRTIPLKPIRDVKIIRGPLDILLDIGKKAEKKDDFYHVELKDDPLNPMQKLRDVYPNVISLEILSKSEYGVDDIDQTFFESLDTESQFNEFFKSRMSGKEMTDSQKKLVHEAMQKGGLI